MPAQLNVGVGLCHPVKISVNSFSTRQLHRWVGYDISVSKQWSCELGLGFSLRAARVPTHHIYIHATCKRHLEKGLAENFLKDALLSGLIMQR